MRKSFKPIDICMDLLHTARNRQLAEERSMKLKNTLITESELLAEPAPGWDDPANYEGYDEWLDQLQLQSDESKLHALEELAMLEENAQMADRCRRQGWLEERSMVVNIRTDFWGRKYIEALHPDHGRTELVLTHDLTFVRKAKLP